MKFKEENKFKREKNKIETRKVCKEAIPDLL